MLDLGLYGKTIEFLDDKLSRDEFEKWIISRFPSACRESMSDDMELMSAIELGFFDYDDALIDVTELKLRILEELGKYRNIVGNFDADKDEE
jgi:hypothetical protein